MNDDGHAPQIVTQSGGCLCGAVRYEINGPLFKAGNCHCLGCQKLSGSGHAFHALFPEEAFTVTGKTQGYKWTADSGNTNTTEFCPVCGSPLFARNSGFPGMVTLRVASLDDPAQIMPQMAVYLKRRQPWDVLDRSLPTFMEMPAMPGVTGNGDGR